MGLRPNFEDSSYYSAELFMFQVKAKKDLTINNLEIHTKDGAARVELSYARIAYNKDNAFNDALWTTAADETVTPLNEISNFGEHVGIFSSALEITVAATEEVSIRVRMFGEDNEFRMESVSEMSIGDVALENNDLELHAGQTGDFEDFEYMYSNPVTIYDGIIYALGNGNADNDNLPKCKDKKGKKLELMHKGKPVKW